MAPYPAKTILAAHPCECGPIEPSLPAAKEPKRRRPVPPSVPRRRALRRRCVEREILNLFRFKLAMYHLETGYTVPMVARLAKISPSLLYRLIELHRWRGYEGIAPVINEIFPPALDLDIFDLERAGPREVKG
jgi:hypothetical protein